MTSTPKLPCSRMFPGTLRVWAGTIPPLPWPSSLGSSYRTLYPHQRSPCAEHSTHLLPPTASSPGAWPNGGNPGCGRRHPVQVPDPIPQTVRGWDSDLDLQTHTGQALVTMLLPAILAQTLTPPAVPSSGNPSSRESLCCFQIQSFCLHRLLVSFHGSPQALSTLPHLLSPFLHGESLSLSGISQLLSLPLPALCTGAPPIVTIKNAFRHDQVSHGSGWGGGGRGSLPVRTSALEAEVLVFLAPVSPACRRAQEFMGVL